MTSRTTRADRETIKADFLAIFAGTKLAAMKLTTEQMKRQVETYRENMARHAEIQAMRNW